MVSTRPRTRLSRDIRRRSAREREQTATARLQIAAARDATAATRDLAALARDQAADARDHAMVALDSIHEQERGPRALTGADILIRAAKQRRRAAEYRAQANQQRAIAAQDRQAAAADREHAGSERAQAAVDREALAHQLKLAETDPLTGARTRAAGLADLEHELERCRRTRGLVVAYVDVIGLKALNDSQGHQAGDELLTRAVALIRGHPARSAPASRSSPPTRAQPN